MVSFSASNPLFEESPPFSELLREQMGEGRLSIPNNQYIQAKRWEEIMEGESHECLNAAILSRIDHLLFTPLSAPLKGLFGFSGAFMGLAVFAATPLFFCYEGAVLRCRGEDWQAAPKVWKIAVSSVKIGLYFLGEGVRDALLYLLNTTFPELPSALGLHWCDLWLINAQNFESDILERQLEISDEENLYGWLINAQNFESDILERQLEISDEENLYGDVVWYHS